MYVTLNNGAGMPLTGLGTAFIPEDRLQEVIRTAYEVGYRRLDTAWLYGNEEVIGNAIRNLAIPREELFITTKIHARNLYLFADRKFEIPRKSVRKAIEQHCRRLKTDKIDLLLIHWPFRKYLHLYEEALEVAASDSGPEIGTVGVSSWLTPHIDKAIKATGVIPAVNQFEINPYVTNERLIKDCQERGIQVESYSSFASQNAKVLLAEPVIKDIASELGATESQVVLRWLTQRGISVVPRSTSRLHLAENLKAEDLTLSDRQIEMISSLNKDSYSRFNPSYTLQWV